MQHSEKTGRRDREPLPSVKPLSESRINRDGLPAGSVAPPFRLPALDSVEISLDQYYGRPVLLVFSAPDCGPCRELMPELNGVPAGLQVLMVSRGSVEENESKALEHGLTFPIVLQQSWEVSRKYGIFATPVAYLINEQGVTVADVAVGTGPILSLAASFFETLAAFRTGITMRPRLEKRLVGLKQELNIGRLQVQEAEERLANLRGVLLQVTGAIQVLGELLAEQEASSHDGGGGSGGDA